MGSAISQQVLGLATSTSPGLAQAGGYNILPAGIVFPFAGGTAPTGFLLCEGQEISKTTYAALYAAIGDDYAEQIDPTTGIAWAAPTAGNFRVPDYRGIFLRGVGTPSGLDAVTRGALQAQKTKPNGLTNSGSNTVSGTAAGQSQGVSNISLASGSAATGGTHQHQVGYGANVFGGGATNPTFGGGGSDPSTNAHNGHTHSVSGTTNIQHSHSASDLTATAAAPTITGDNETRPINKGVAYIIKA